MDSRIMGIYSRDYIRDENGPSRFGGGGVATTCKQLIIVSVVVFVLQLVTRHDGPPGFAMPSSVVGDWLELSPNTLLHGQVWRVVTYAFCHDIRSGFPFHLLFNMLFLWWFGKTLELMYGSREFLFFYLSAAAFAGLAFVGLSLVLREHAAAIGASGAIMAIMMVYAMHFPRQRIYIWGIIPLEIRWLVVAYVAFDLWPILEQLGGRAPGDGVAHSAHLGGLLFGFLYKRYNIRLSGFVAGQKVPRFGGLFRRKQKFRIYEPSAHESHETPDDLEAKVDRILEKISRDGEGSLTESEREILKTASRRYKNR